MSGRRSFGVRPRVAMVGLFAVLSVPYALRAQVDEKAPAALPPNPPSPVTGIRAEEEKLYGGARPYMDEELPKLKGTVRQLMGLTPASDQEQLAHLLARVAAKSDELLHKIPNLISDESVSEQQRKDAGQMEDCVGRNCRDIFTGSVGRRDQKFSYMILTRPREGSGQMLEEYRAGRNGKPVTQGTSLPYFQGFIATWLIFSSLNQVESHFRYLGEQKTDGHNTFVIGFAQIPGLVEQPGQYMSGAGSIPMLLQGIAWVDQSDFRIVRLRTDLLAPQPESKFLQQTSNIMFGPVQIAGHEDQLWLPESVDVEMQANAQFLREQHEYSRYRLYQASTKMVQPAN